MAVPPDEVEQRMRRFVETCRQAGLRVTHQRTEVFRELASTDEHPDAEAIYRRVHERIPAVSLDTVYRTLALLEEKGLVSRTAVRSGAARFDSNTDPHHHFVCTTCGRIRDFECPSMDAIAIPEAAREMGTITTWQIHVHGICTDCLAGRRGNDAEA